jgi:hypothetical protein
VINQGTDNYLLNLFWPLGLYNKTEFNKNIPFSGKYLTYLASTSGWWYCNHGSALLGALELDASQGYNEDELYKLALQLNSFWFPQNYIETAIYFKVFENKDCQKTDPKLVMSREYSSISGWMQNVYKKVIELNLPQIQSRGGC